MQNSLVNERIMQSPLRSQVRYSTFKNVLINGSREIERERERERESDRERGDDKEREKWGERDRQKVSERERKGVSL